MLDGDLRWGARLVYVQRPVSKGQVEMDKSGAGRGAKPGNVKESHSAYLRCDGPAVVGWPSNPGLDHSQLKYARWLYLTLLNGAPRSAFIHLASTALRHWLLHVDLPSTPAQIAAEHCLRSVPDRPTG